MTNHIFRDHNRGIDQYPDGDGDAGEGHDIAGDAEFLHQQERDQDGDRQRQGDDEYAAEVPEEKDVCERDENDFFGQGVLQSIYGRGRSACFGHRMAGS